MGGLMILASISFSTLLLEADMSNRYVLISLGVLLSFGLIGFVDDYRKVVRKDPKGLIAKWKYFWQSAIALAVAAFLYFTAVSPDETKLVIPFLKTLLPSLAYFLLCWHTSLLLDLAMPSILPMA